MKINTKAVMVLMLAVTGGAYAADFSDLQSLKVSDKALSAISVPAANKGYVVGNDPTAGAPDQAVEFVSIPGGKFTMGTDEATAGFEDAKPIREVTIKTFQMAKTAVTVEQYAECVIKGKCTAPATGGYCNWGKQGRQDHPVNCVDYNQAQAYARFMGARLPSEAEFEYAATSGGRNQKYPWGNAAPVCDRVVMGGCARGPHEEKYGTLPVCSRIAGNTAQGLCDMSGNVWQWVQDVYNDSYNGAPVDGSAFEGAGSHRVIRGGSFLFNDASFLRADFRINYDPASRYDFLGFRLVR